MMPLRTYLMITIHLLRLTPSLDELGQSEYTVWIVNPIVRPMRILPEGFAMISLVSYGTTAACARNKIICKKAY